MVSRTDLLWATPPGINPFAANRSEDIDLRFTAADVMRKGTVTLTSGMLIDEAVELLSKHRMGAAPVVMSESLPTLVGMLSQTDLARAFQELLAPDHDERRSIWELAQDPLAEVVGTLTEELALSVSSSGGELRGAWRFSHGDAAWMVVVTRGVPDLEPVRKAMPKGTRLLHAT